ncbi:bifunctional salicylyl-CoA 5-hydroxylase/oxidoreductase [Tessaracoccus sp.]
MRIAIIGGGPGGLYFAALMKQLDPSHDITVWERNRADDTFGFGVVFSDETLGGIANADPEFATMMSDRFARWTDIDIDVDGQTFTIGGQGFAALTRKELLMLMQQRCADLGIPMHFESLAPDVEELSRDYDLVLAADGLNSPTRNRWADDFGATLDPRKNMYVWLGTSRVFEAFQFIVRNTEWGTMQVHAYPYGQNGSTFIVEMDETVWRAAGFDMNEGRQYSPGESDEESIAKIRELFADYLDGYEVHTNNSRWIRFNTVRNTAWHRGNVVILGDAAHTAHFSIGSGTKLAMEDAMALAACFHEHSDTTSALEAYEAERMPVAASLQRAAQASLEWFENIGMYAGQDPEQFAFNLLTRSRRITRENIGVRDPDYAARVDAMFARISGQGDVVPAMFQPYDLGGLPLKNRIVVSPMDMYSAIDGMPQDFHMVHLGSKALGGAGLVMTEMVCVSADGRITLGCTGLYTDAQGDAYRRIVDFVHEQSTAKICLQLGHSGRKGSTKLMWEGIDEPLAENNWEVIAPSALPYKEGSATPRELSEQDLATLVDEFVSAAVRGAAAGFDALELHCAHGYLLSSFLSPLTNQRTDSYGGSQENRLKFPLRVFDAVREVWPEGRPLGIRISAVDWAPDGNAEHDAVEISRAFIEHGAAFIHVSSGQVVGDERPMFGRSYQTPFADRIRQEVAHDAGVAVIAVGAISSYDDVNSILLAGRADLCAIGRTHLYDPQWTLHAAAEQGYVGDAADWPVQFAAGKRKPPSARTDAVRPRLELLREANESGLPTHLRWTPNRRVGDIDAQS